MAGWKAWRHCFKELVKSTNNRWGCRKALMKKREEICQNRIIWKLSYHVKVSACTNRTKAWFYVYYSSIFFVHLSNLLVQALALFQYICSVRQTCQFLSLTVFCHPACSSVFNKFSASHLKKLYLLYANVWVVIVAFSLAL